MPIIHVTGWPMESEDKARKPLEDLTATLHRVTGIPLDKISAYMTEVPPGRWADAGVVGTDPDFPTKSRRLNYAQNEEGAD